MCGIVGYFGQPRYSGARSGLLQRMVAAIGHRGPDDRGIHVDDHAGLGHARLAIIDLHSGHQPMSNADGTVWVTFNGEIFNYLELRHDLGIRGRRFRTRSDTEVLLQLYEEFGPSGVERLNGDFAFAIWDQTERRMVLARDRMGVRPLYYRTRGNCLYFASEIKALAETPGFRAELDPLALDQIFTFWSPLAPRTPFKGISELPQAHIMVADDKGTVIRPYWRLDYPHADDPGALDQRSEQAIAERLRHLLMDAVRLRLRSDVPVGAYLSGGLDSSIVTAAINDISPEHLRSFSVAFDSTEHDESAFQARMVEALRTRHSAVTIKSSAVGQLFPSVVQAAEQPLVRTGPAPLLALSGHVRQSGIKVVMTGEGADEVFAGYDIFKEAKIRRFCARQPTSTRRPQLLRRLYEYLPGIKAQSQSYLESFFKAGAADPRDPLYSHLPRFGNTAAAKIFYSADLKRELTGYDAIDDLRARLPADFERWHPLSQAQYLETAYLLPGYILSSQGDRMSMANAVEGRYPFLDHRLVEFAARIPPNLKLRVLREKHVLREATARLLPKDIADRPKQPYRAPDHPSFFGADAPDYVGSVLAPSAIARCGYFNPKAVSKLTAKCSGRGATSFRDTTALVGILSSQLWHNRFVENLTAETDPATICA